MENNVWQWLHTSTGDADTWRSVHEWNSDWRLELGPPSSLMDFQMLPLDSL